MTMAIKAFVFFVIFYALFNNGLSLQCVDERGEPVDWFIVYKIPVIQKTTNYLLRKGLAYAYITSSNDDADWKLSGKSINDSLSIIAQTLQPLYKDPKNWFHILYNDEPPSSSTSLTYGHTKGVVMADKDKGFWLIHSVPNFPIEPCPDKPSDKPSDSPKEPACDPRYYFYPSSATRYGQTLMCISLASSQLNTVGTQLQFNRPKIYSRNIPPYIESLEVLVNAANNKFVKSPPWNNKANFTSMAGVKFLSFAKASKFNKELYSDWVAIDLQENLNVETWANGAGDFPSECTKTFKVQDVKEVSMNFDKNNHISFKNTQDHSKWAMSLDKKKPWVCVGDINRMMAQLKRGGGTVCFQNPNVWGKFTKMTTEVEKCFGKKS